MIEQIPWHSQAACRDVSALGLLNIFWGTSREWRPYCSSCPVAWECLQYAFENDEREGVYGGMPPERRQLFVKKHHNPKTKAAALDHRNEMKKLRRLAANDDRSVGIRQSR